VVAGEDDEQSLAVTEISQRVAVAVCATEFEIGRFVACFEYVFGVECDHSQLWSRDEP
jgi:hypothetical protein